MQRSASTSTREPIWAAMLPEFPRLAHDYLRKADENHAAQMEQARQLRKLRQDLERSQQRQ